MTIACIIPLRLLTKEGATTSKTRWKFHSTMTSKQWEIHLCCCLWNLCNAWQNGIPKITLTMAKQDISPIIMNSRSVKWHSLLPTNIWNPKMRPNSNKIIRSGSKEWRSLRKEYNRNKANKEKQNKIPLKN